MGGDVSCIDCTLYFCALVGLFISNTATAILMAPIAISLATQLNVSPVPFAMVVAIAASAAFMTPVSSPVNTMVVGPGDYKFADFIKIGVPFTLIIMLVTVFYCANTVSILNEKERSKLTALFIPQRDYLFNFAL